MECIDEIRKHQRKMIDPKGHGSTGNPKELRDEKTPHPTHLKTSLARLGRQSHLRVLTLKSTSLSLRHNRTPTRRARWRIRNGCRTPWRLSGDPVGQAQARQVETNCKSLR